MAINDLAKNLKNESDITWSVPPQSSSVSTASLASLQLPLGLEGVTGHGNREPKREPHNIIDDQDETSTSNASMASKFEENKNGNGNDVATNMNPAGSFLGMAAASLMDPSAAKGNASHKEQISKKII